MPVLPVFPLGAVLLPGAPLQMQIFEPRYVQLLMDLRELEPLARVFGIVAIRRGHEVGPGQASDLYPVGCLARIHAAEVVRPQGRPVYRLVVVGTERFHLDALVDVGRPYPTAEVTVLDETDGEKPVETRRAAERLVSAFVTYRRAVGAPETDIPGPEERVAAQVVDAMPMGLRDRQRVLEAGGTTARIRAALALVQRENAIIATFGAVAGPRGEVSPN
ncbi:LON peptidase substrate-binding domain-containing protein [Janibacter sp. YIM B02568]|uniref:LON peptidase substrate-binding domain-containing protein n=1 Tax=Janibacter endophyticus TaxID=2806261 RepID=UPI00194F16D2|nr:LON peptidase substrate-binding domain-containing protein [Janibacter endophyticus]MBM6546414.1 LON peptidase substrate-binding domain-containing protein [Janibacter endophyticus]